MDGITKRREKFATVPVSSRLRTRAEGCFRSPNHDKHFPKDEKDHVWIPVVAARGWLIISCDKRIKSWRAEGGLGRAAAVESRAKMFFMGRGGRSLPDYAYDIGHARHKILRLAKKHRGRCSRESCGLARSFPSTWRNRGPAATVRGSDTGT